MKKQPLLLALLALVVAGLSSCRKEGDVVPDPNDIDYISTYTEQFESIWRGMNSCYVHWDIDTTDWDAMYLRYKPVFERFDSIGVVSNDELGQVYKKILGGLIDYHLDATIRNIKASGSVYVNPGKTTLLHRTEQCIPYNGFDDIYASLEEQNRLAEWVSEQEFSHFQEVTTGLIDGNVVYLHLNKFQLQKLLDEEEKGLIDNQGRNVLAAFRHFEDLVARPNIGGVIFDLRYNGGGDARDIQVTGGPIIQNPYNFASTHTKAGIGRLDYSAWKPVKVKPAKNRIAHSIPVVALCDANSGSMAEIMTIFIKNLPYGHVIGVRTYGATGPVTESFEAYYCGSIGKEGGAYYIQMASQATIDMNGVRYEGVGIVPDEIVEFSNEEFDPQLTRAIEYINNH